MIILTVIRVSCPVIPNIPIDNCPPLPEPGMRPHLLLLVPCLLALQAPPRQSNPGLDIFSSIADFRRSLLELLAKGLPGSARPPKAPGRPQHTILLPPRPPVPHDLSRPNTVFSPPVLPQLPPHHMVKAVSQVQQHIAAQFPHVMDGHSSFPSSSAFTIFPGPSPLEGLDQPSVGNTVHRPSPAQHSHNIRPAQHSHSTSHISSPQEAAGAALLVNGPHSFVDSTRVHAGEALAEELSHDLSPASHVPLDLWREDLVGIKAHKKERGVKVHHDMVRKEGRVVRRKARRRSSQATHKSLGSNRNQ